MPAPIPLFPKLPTQMKVPSNAQVTEDRLAILAIVDDTVGDGAGNGAIRQSLDSATSLGSVIQIAVPSEHAATELNGAAFKLPTTTLPNVLLKGHQRRMAIV